MKFAVLTVIALLYSAILLMAFPARAAEAASFTHIPLTGKNETMRKASAFRSLPDSKGRAAGAESMYFRPTGTCSAPAACSFYNRKKGVTI